MEQIFKKNGILIRTSKTSQNLGKRRYLRSWTTGDETGEGDVDPRTSENESLWNQNVGLARKVAGHNFVPHFVVKSEKTKTKKNLSSFFHFLYLTDIPFTIR